MVIVKVWLNSEQRRFPSVILYCLFVTTVSQLKICDFSGETFKGFEVLLSAMSATTTQLFSSSEFCKLRYDTTCSKCIYKCFVLYQ
jgi:hypothetical protein